MTSVSLLALAPLILGAAALVFVARPGRRPGRWPVLAEAASLAALGLGLAGAVQLWASGPQVWQAGALALVRLDAVSVTMALLVGFVGWVVVRYARRYLDGEAREGRFHGLTLMAIAAVLLLVQAASLPVLIAGFVAVGAVLRQLLLFYPERAEAQRAATKFSRVWGAGDVALILAAVLLWQSFGTLDLAALNAQAALPPLAQVAVGLLVLAAALKTATFPLHGWLTEVMEAPTPVSALLHAGIINSGGVLLITLAGLVQTSAGAMAALVMIGGLTALFGGLVMLTQSAVKTALAWSTVAQMGFMLLQCGLGLWALALLHIVAHSLYKAHAFLSSGGAVRAVNALRKPGPVAVPGLGAVARALGLALVLYAAVAAGFTVLVGEKSPQALALGAMLIFGVSYLIAQGLADSAPGALTRRTMAASVAAALAYFGFQVLAQTVWGPSLPATPVAGALEWAMIVLAVLSFGLVAFAQALFPLWAHHPSTAGLRVHLANGLYLNALLDRLTGGFRTAAKS
ncbi:proton-conducting transporter transmembrane domain-containing protein [Pseudotabrizicola algicola]|uniref:Probable inorganic carbon transporter subunit DabB n=1 Tax=Pseudotabrizicola algicola TaxID=2709381 RepID=A0A6B3RNP1_9RHOB|nr:proton-conducting transporter membrane subunit [Pseudotabrizicola algicola]NEX47717.1 oxidoreductase [Pseudotabrizicola algicola]